MNSSTSTSCASADPRTRVVLFMTALAPGDVPVAASTPACTLAFGSATFAERVLDSCARAGVREVDVVACDQPEKLREALGDGFRWAMKINWHLAKDGVTPYSLLRTLGVAVSDRVLIGHGHCWIADGVVRALLQSNRVAVRIGQDVRWTGWASIDERTMRSIAPFDDYAAVADRFAGRDPSKCLLVEPSEVACAGSAVELYEAQQVALRNEGDIHVPATWVKHPWGAASPTASVHPFARVQGPVLVGPGCTVGNDAEIGPCVVLSRDVLVADGAVVRDALILPNTYVGGAVQIERAVVNGGSVQDLKWSVRMTLQQRDAVVAELVAAKLPQAGYIGRAVAALLAMVTLPAFAVVALWQWLRMQRPPWKCIDAVTGRRKDSELLKVAKVREAAGSGRCSSLLGTWGALLDVVQGRRQWFGVRARRPSQWYALRRDWQALFEGTPIGIFHAPAWSDRQATPDGEAVDAADAYFAVNRSWRERWRALVAAV